MLLAILSALVLAAVLGASVPASLPAAEGPVQFPTDPAWTILTFVMALGVGTASGVAIVFILARREGSGLSIAIAATLVNLVAGGLLTFYVAQFGAMASAIGHLLLLALLLDYRGRRAVDR